MENRKILIIDDVDLTSALQTMLESNKYSVSVAPNKEECMEKIKAETPDMIILDVMMNTCQDGFDMARELKKNEQYSTFPYLCSPESKTRPA